MSSRSCCLVRIECHGPVRAFAEQAWTPRHRGCGRRTLGGQRICAVDSHCRCCTSRPHDHHVSCFAPRHSGPIRAGWSAGSSAGAGQETVGAGKGYRSQTTASHREKADGTQEDRTAVAVMRRARAPALHYGSQNRGPDHRDAAAPARLQGIALLAARQPTPDRHARPHSTKWPPLRHKVFQVPSTHRRRRAGRSWADRIPAACARVDRSESAGGPRG